MSVLQCSSVLPMPPKVSVSLATYYPHLSKNFVSDDAYVLNSYEVDSCVVLGLGFTLLSWCCKWPSSCLGQRSSNALRAGADSVPERSMCKNHVRKRAVGGGAASESEPLATSSAEEPLAAADSAKPPPLARAVWSSGVPFFPPSERYWRIGGVWYDFASFVDRHPGGREVILLARDRFEDATYVFEAHHHDYARARKIIAKYARSHRFFVL